LLKRTHTCGEITADLDHQIVTINGWVDRVRNLGGVLFVTVRDRYGKIQVLFRPEDDALFSCAASLRGEDVVAVCGRVTRRPDTAIKEDTGGAVEIIAEKFEVLSKALTPPFYIHIESDVNEELRLTYRYLDLRRQRMQKNIQLRHQVVQAVRAYFNEHSFLEIETPILTKSTPEGARDFLVPSRLKPGKFYALPQSPQLFTQLLMVSGFDRYYQIARCFRDEDFRADRQPELKQIDYEMSFVEQQDIM
jgi:aspartyl-tRNA synthetase